MSEKQGNKVIHHPERANSRLKFLDRFLGIPLVFLHGLGKRNKNGLQLSRVKHIAFLQTAAIGDTVLSSAIVQDVKKACPAARVTFFAGASNFETANLIPGVDAVVRLPVKRPLASIRIIREKGPFDLWIDCGPWARLNALFSRYSAAGLTIGFRTDGQYRHYGYDFAVPHSSSRHEIDNYRSLLNTIGISETTSETALNIRQPSVNKQQVVIHMFPGGSRSFLKEWPVERWVELIDIVTSDGYTVALTGTSVNRPAAERVRSKVKQPDRVTLTAGNLDIAATAELLAGASAVISVDTGIMHIASALKCNLVALHGPTSPRRWGPLNRNAVSLYPSVPCTPCLSLGYESRCKKPECMIHISVNDVNSAFRKVIARG